MRSCLFEILFYLRVKTSSTEYKKQQVGVKASFKGCFLKIVENSLIIEDAMKVGILYIQFINKVPNSKHVCEEFFESYMRGCR